jgi:hypothetical protein
MAISIVVLLERTVVLVVAINWTDFASTHAGFEVVDGQTTSKSPG